MDSLRYTPLLLVALVTIGATCNDNDGKTGADAAVTADSTPLVEIEGIPTEKLERQEHRKWSGYVTQFLAPCPDVAVPVRQCITEKRDCKACRPAAEFLLRQARAGLPKEDVAKAYKLRFSAKSVKTIAIDDSPSKGPKDAPVQLVEFADFECPACMMFYPLLEEMYRTYGKEMRVVYKHFPLEQHPNARLAAQASYAAQKQGQFWKMHRMLFEAQGKITEPDLMSYAKAIGLDMKRFQKDLHSDAAKERWEKDQKQGETLGIVATPTIYINGREANLALFKDRAVQELEAWIRLEIELAGKKPPEPASLSSGEPSPSAAPSASAGPSASAAQSASAAPGAGAAPSAGD
jgi:protein-disulfide isomerase